MLRDDSVRRELEGTKCTVAAVLRAAMQLGSTHRCLTQDNYQGMSQHVWRVKQMPRDKCKICWITFISWS